MLTNGIEFIRFVYCSKSGLEESSAVTSGTDDFTITGRSGTSE